MKCGCSKDVRRSHCNLIDLQQAICSGYKKQHGLRALVVTFPMGIVGGVYITEIRQNNNEVLNISNLSNNLVELLGSVRVGRLFFCLYDDSIFKLLPTLIPRQRSPCHLAASLVNIRLSNLLTSNLRAGQLQSQKLLSSLGSTSLSLIALQGWLVLFAVSLQCPSFC